MIWEKLKKLTDAKVGEILIFTYNGGSTPGRDRTVVVTSIGKHTITGVDKEINEPRTFNNSFAVNIEGLAASDTQKMAVNFIVARNEIMERIEQMTGEELAALYGEYKQVSTRFNSQNGCIEYDIPTPKTFNVDGKTMSKDELVEFVKNMG